MLTGGPDEPIFRQEVADMPEFHDALTHGCYVVTTSLNGRLYGMTCSWATQVDFDKVMLVLGKQSSTGRAIRKSRVFGVSVLSTDQKDLAVRFGSGHSSRKDKFDGVTTRTGTSGVPLLDGSLKTFVCRLVDDADFGSDICYVGTIAGFRKARKQTSPLLLSQVDH
jgi:flavin reductase (DIM6/NTAB) family NADH-FMN oxidoreductase RutF